MVQPPTLQGRSGAGPKRPRRAAAFLVSVVALLLAGCAKTSQTPLMKDLSPKELSSQELRARLYNAVDRSNRIIAESADEIRVVSDDPLHQENALRWKIFTTGQMLAAAFRVDPLLGMLDSWAFAAQMEQVFRSGPLVDYFGDHTSIAYEAQRESFRLFDELADHVLLEPDSARGYVERFVRDYPFTSMRAGRTSVLDVMERMEAEYRTSAMGVGEMQATVEDINARAPLMLATAIRQALWRTELILEERGVTGSLTSIARGVEDIGGGVDEISLAVTELLLALEQLDSLTFVVDDGVNRALGEVDRQRRETLDAVTAERIAILAAIDDVYDDALTSLMAERVAIMASVDSITQRTLEDGTSRLTDVVDHAFWRGVQLLFLFAALALVVGLVLTRRTRRPS